MSKQRPSETTLTVNEQIKTIRVEQQSIQERFAQDRVPFADAQRLIDRFRELEQSIAELRSRQFRRTAELILDDADPHEAPCQFDVERRLHQFAVSLVTQLHADYPASSILELVDQLADVPEGTDTH